MKTWREIMDVISTLSEDEVLELLKQERRGPRRPTIMVRLHQRYTALRATREREEMLNER